MIKISSRLVFVFFVVFAISFIPTTVFSASKTVTISGKQVKGSAGANAKLSSKAVKLTKDSKVVAVTGDNKGFWISTRSGIVSKHWVSNDKKVIGLKLKKGTYFIYPNLKRGKTTATVTITVQ